MEPKLLGFIDAVRLAQVLNRYNLQDVGGSYRDYTFELVNVISPLDYQEILNIFFPEQTILENVKGEALLGFIIGSFEINKIFNLIQIYRGFVNDTTKS